VGQNRRVSMTLLLAGAAAWTASAAASALPDALQACTKERDDSRRLACYDRETAKLAVAPDKSYGLSPEQQRKLEPPETRDIAKPQVVSSVMSSVSQRADGRMVFTLADGEIWVQGEAWERFDVRVGEAVTIKPGVLGSFHLYASSGLATRVTRAR
jgi:hypothetical protein